MTSLPETIRSLRDAFETEDGLSATAINSGLCADFADAITSSFGMESAVFSIDDLFDDSGGLVTVSAPPPGTDWNLLERIGVPDDLSHSWILFDGRHYDAEAPDGVDNPFDLACVRHGLHELLERRNGKLLDELTESYGWWREAARLRLEREPLLPGPSEQRTTP